MKKIMLAFIAGLIAVVAASSMASAAEITIGGEIESRYVLWSNLVMNDGLHGDQFHLGGAQSFFDSRITLNVDAKVAEGLEAYIQLQQDNTPWGNTSNPRRFVNHNVNENDYFFNDPGPMSSSDRKDPSNNGIAINQAWINFMVPGLPVGVKVGHQPLALGHGIWLDTSRYGSDAVLAYSKPIPQLLVAAAYVKGLEGSPTTPVNSNLNLGITAAGPLFDVQPGTSDNQNRIGAGSDADFGAILANYTWMENNTAGVNVTYAHDSSDWIGQFFGPTVGAKGRFNIRAVNVGVVADGAVAGVNYKYEFDWLYVNVADFGSNALGLDGGLAYIESGFAMMGGASYNVMGMVNVGLEGAYGSGNGSKDPGIIYGVLSGPSFGTAFNDDGRSGRRDHAYATPYQLATYNYAYLYNDKIGQGPFGVGGGKGFGDGYGGFGLANTGFIKLSMSGAPMEKMTAGLDVLWLRAADRLTPGQSRDLGWEIDGKASYKLYDNLSLDLRGGVFMPGNWYAFKGLNDLNTFGAINEDLTEDGTDTGNLKHDTAAGGEARLTVKF